MLDTLSDTKDICMTFANRILYDFLLALQLLSNHAPEGRPGMSDVSPLSGILGLSFDSTLLSPLLFLQCIHNTVIVDPMASINTPPPLKKKTFKEPPSLNFAYMSYTKYPDVSCNQIG